MIIKRVITIVLIILLINTNFVYAENWVTVSAENGKSADLDLDSIQLVIDTVEYNIRTFNNDITYINKLSTDLYKEGIPTAVIYRSKYKNNLKIGDETINKREYRVLKSGTLQAEIFDVLSKELDKKSFTKGKATWNKYLKKQRKQIYEKWEPRKDVWQRYYNYPTPVFFSDSLLIIDKNGIVKSKNNDGGVLQDLHTIDPLPEDYTAETFQLNVKMNHYKYAGAKLYTKTPAVKQISPVSSEITIAKNQRPPVLGHIEFGLLWLNNKMKAIEQWNFAPTDNIFLGLIEFPVGIITFVGALAIEIISSVLCVISGVSIDDL